MSPLLRGKLLRFQKLEIAKNGGKWGAQVVRDVGDLPAETLLLLPQCACFLLSVLQQAVDLSQEVLYLAVRRKQTEALAGLGTGLAELLGSPI